MSQSRQLILSTKSNLVIFRKIFLKGKYSITQLEFLFSVVKYIIKGISSPQQVDFFSPELANSEGTCSHFFFKTPKCSYWLVECSFDNPTKHLRWKSKKILAQNPKKNIFLKKLFSSICSSRHVECKFDNPDKNSCSKSEIFSLRVQKNYGSIFFSPDMFRGIFGTQFWQPCRKFFAQPAKFFC